MNYALKIVHSDLIFRRYKCSCSHPGRAAGLGHLKEGAVTSVSTLTARKLLGSPPAPVLEALGSALQFELAVGVNGRVWVQAESASTVVMVLNAITSSERLNDTQVRTLVARMLAQTASAR